MYLAHGLKDLTFILIDMQYVQCVLVSGVEKYLMKICSASLAIMQIKMKTTVRYHYISIKMSKIKKVVLSHTCLGLTDSELQKLVKAQVAKCPPESSLYCSHSNQLKASGRLI